MRISVFGLGYVGCVSAACLARRGHDVVGVDVNEEKVRLTNAGRSPIVERDLDAILGAAVAEGRLRATTSCPDALASSEASLICVGTPSTAAGRLDLHFLERLGDEIGAGLRAKTSGMHTVVLRSTVLPGTTEGVLVPLLEGRSGLRAGDGFRVAYNPEFIREGTAVQDFEAPPKTVIGTADPEALATVERLYAGLPGPHIHTSVRVAEMGKYVDNAFHALKVAFANEIGSLCSAEGIESHEVMDVFVQDHKLNVSPAYLRPGFAFGGSCLPKDLRALVARAKDHDLEATLLRTILRSNEELVQRAVDAIQRLGRRRVGVLGLSFKAGTDDLRESPMVELVERLVGKGFTLEIHDENVHLARLIGSNKAYVEEHLPHIAGLLRADLPAVVRASDVLVIGSQDPAYRAIPALTSQTQIVIDLVRLFERPPEGLKGYRALV